MISHPGLSGNSRLPTSISRVLEILSWTNPNTQGRSFNRARWIQKACWYLLCWAHVCAGCPWGGRGWEGSHVVLGGSFFLSEEELCLLGTLPCSQHLQKMFLIPASGHRAGSKRQQDSPVSPGHQSPAPRPKPEGVLHKEGVFGGRERRRSLTHCWLHP